MIQSERNLDTAGGQQQIYKISLIIIIARETFCWNDDLLLNNLFLLVDRESH